LDHPRIPKYIDSFETEDGFCLVQEYIDARSLAKIPEWKPRAIKNIAVSILDILVYLQNKNIFHRDIKPENILIDENDNIYLIDFGCAKINHGESSTFISGTMGFMPPEQRIR
jgi:serine/threonine protein kinase